MWIYLITNQINGKLYVGKTEREDYRRRWNEHRKDCYKDKRGILLYRAMRKHGLDNFKFEILLKCSNPDELADKETEFILKYNSLSPNGYNLVLHQDKLVISLESKEKRSKSKQGSCYTENRKTSKYLGVCIDNKLFACEICRFNETYRRRFGNEIEAAKKYDQMALYLYGDDAVLNFKKEDYSQDEINNTYEYFTKNPYSSKYFGVAWTLAKSRWRASLKRGNKCIHIKYVRNEVEAAKLVDMGIIYYSIDHTLNFPELKEEYLKLNLNEIFKKKEKASKYIGVYYYKASNKFVSKIEMNKKVYHCGYFDTQEEAYSARINKEKEIKQNLYGNKI